MILPYTPDLLLFTPDLLFRLREYFDPRDRTDVLTFQSSKVTNAYLYFKFDGGCLNDVGTGSSGAASALGSSDVNYYGHHANCYQI